MEFKISEDLISGLDYFASQEAEEKYTHMEDINEDSYVLSSIPNETTGHVGPMELSSYQDTLDFIEELKAEIPRRIINR